MAGKAGKVQFRQLSENEFEFAGQSYEFFPNTPLIPSEMWNGSAEELIADWNLEDLGNGDAVVLPVEFEVDHATGEVTAVMAFTTGIGITALPSPWQFDLDQETVVVVSQDPHGTDLVLKAVRGSKQDVVRYFGKLGKTAEIEGVPVNLN